MTAPTPIPERTLAALRSALQAEQVAAFGYGTLGPRLTAPDRTGLARSCEQAHRDLADTTLAVINSSAGAASASVPPTNYQLPIAAGDDTSAQQLAIRLEQTCSTAWRYVLAVLADSAGPDPDPLWTSAASALTASSVRAVRWRRSAAVRPVSVAFPGIAT